MPHLIQKSVLLLTSLVSLTQAPPRADREVVLIPHGYTGDIFIVFRVPSGQPPAREGDARFYRIPPNGILLTQEAPNIGLSPVWTFYYESPTGERERIERIWGSRVPSAPDSQTNPSIEIFFPGRGRHGNGPTACEFDNYFVGTRMQAIGRDRVISLRRLDSVMRTVKGCESRASGLSGTNRPTAPERMPATPFQQLPGDQHLSVVYGKWIRGTTPLEVEDFAMNNLLVESDRDLLGTAITNGRVTIRGGSSGNRVQSPRARMIIIFTGPLVRPVRLRQPDASSILYVQEGNEFRRYPPNGRLLDHSVEFTPNASRSEVAHIWIERVWGRTGGSAFIGDR